MTLGEPTESEKQVMQAKSYISDSFDYSHDFQNYDKKHMIFRNIGNLTDHSHQKMIFLTVVACEIGRNSYFAGTDPEGWVRCLVGIMGNWLYK